MKKTNQLLVNPYVEESIEDLILRAFENENRHVNTLLAIHHSDMELEHNHLNDYIAYKLLGNRSDDVDSITCKELKEDGGYYLINVDMCLKKILDDCTIIKNIVWHTDGIKVNLPTEAVMFEAVGKEGRKEVDEFLFRLANCEWEAEDFDIVW